MALPIDYITKNDRKLRKINTTFAVKPSSPLAPIPEAKQPSGKVSFEEGFGNKYSTPLTAGGEAIRGDNFNALMNDITTDLKNTRKVLKNEWKEPLVFTVGTRPEDDYNDLCFALHDIVMKYQPGCVGTAVGVSATDKTLWGGGAEEKTVSGLRQVPLPYVKIVVQENFVQTTQVRLEHYDFSWINVQVENGGYLVFRSLNEYPNLILINALAPSFGDINNGGFKCKWETQVNYTFSLFLLSGLSSLKLHNATIDCGKGLVANTRESSVFYITGGGGRSL